jgi:hypothetical protein
MGAAALAVGAALQAAAALAPSLVEHYYSQGVFPGVQRVQSYLTGWTGFPVGEFLLVVLVVVGLAGVVRAIGPGGRRGARLLSFLGGVAIASAVTYWGFLLLWGLNYGREPFGELAGLDTAPASADELEALSRHLVEEANVARTLVQEDETGVMRVGRGRAGTLVRAEPGFHAAARLYPFLDGPRVRPKLLLLSPLASHLGISGIYNPFTGEANVNSTLPDPDLPFATSHEIAHQRGFAREDEANYVGYLACRLHPDPDFRYSGLLSATLYVQQALLGARRRAADTIEKIRSAGVRRDIRALQAWAERYEGPVRDAGEKVNDAYLKTQGQAGGLQSYGRVVDLLLAERRRATEGAGSAR